MLRATGHARMVSAHDIDKAKYSSFGGLVYGDNSFALWSRVPWFEPTRSKFYIKSLRYVIH